MRKETTENKHPFEFVYQWEVAKRVVEPGIGVSQVCKDMNLWETAVHRC